MKHFFSVFTKALGVSFAFQLSITLLLEFFGPGAQNLYIPDSLGYFFALLPLSNLMLIILFFRWLKTDNYPAKTQRYLTLSKILLISVLFISILRVGIINHQAENEKFQNASIQKYKHFIKTCESYKINYHSLTENLFTIIPLAYLSRTYNCHFAINKKLSEIEQSKLEHAKKEIADSVPLDEYMQKMERETCSEDSDCILIPKCDCKGVIPTTIDAANSIQKRMGCELSIMDCTTNLDKKEHRHLKEYVQSIRVHCKFKRCRIEQKRQ